MITQRRSLSLFNNLGKLVFNDPLPVTLEKLRASLERPRDPKSQTLALDSLAALSFLYQRSSTQPAQASSSSLIQEALLEELMKNKGIPTLFSTIRAFKGSEEIVAKAFGVLGEAAYFDSHHLLGPYEREFIVLANQHLNNSDSLTIVQGVLQGYLGFMKHTQAPDRTYAHLPGTLSKLIDAPLSPDLSFYIMTMFAFLNESFPKMAGALHKAGMFHFAHRILLSAPLRERTFDEALKSATYVLESFLPNPYNDGFTPTSPEATKALLSLVAQPETANALIERFLSLRSSTNGALVECFHGYIPILCMNSKVFLDALARREEAMPVILDMMADLSIGQATRLYLLKLLHLVFDKSPSSMPRDMPQVLFPFLLRALEGRREADHFTTTLGAQLLTRMISFVQTTKTIEQTLLQDKGTLFVKYILALINSNHASWQKFAMASLAEFSTNSEDARRLFSTRADLICEVGDLMIEAWSYQDSVPSHPSDGWRAENAEVNNNKWYPLRTSGVAITRTPDAQIELASALASMVTFLGNIDFNSSVIGVSGIDRVLVAISALKPAISLTSLSDSSALSVSKACLSIAKDKVFRRYLAEDGAIQPLAAMMASFQTSVRANAFDAVALLAQEPGQEVPPRLYTYEMLGVMVSLLRRLACPDTSTIFFLDNFLKMFSQIDNKNSTSRPSSAHSYYHEEQTGDFTQLPPPLMQATEASRRHLATEMLSLEGLTSTRFYPLVLDILLESISNNPWNGGVFLRSNVLPFLTRALQDKNDLQQHALGACKVFDAIASLPANRPLMGGEKGLDAILKLLGHASDERLLFLVIKILNKFPPSAINVVDDASRVIRRLLDVLDAASSHQLKIEILRALSRIRVSSSADVQQALAEDHLLSVLDLVGSSHAPVREQALACLLALCRQSSFVQNTIIDEGRLPALVEILKDQGSMHGLLEREAAAHLLSIVSSSPRVAKLVSKEDVDDLADLFSSGKVEPCVRIPLTLLLAHLYETPSSALEEREQAGVHAVITEAYKLASTPSSPEEGSNALYLIAQCINKVPGGVEFFSDLSRVLAPVSHTISELVSSPQTDLRVIQRVIAYLEAFLSNTQATASMKESLILGMKGIYETCFQTKDKTAGNNFARQQLLKAMSFSPAVSMSLFVRSEEFRTFLFRVASKDPLQQCRLSALSTVCTLAQNERARNHLSKTNGSLLTFLLSPSPDAKTLSIAAETMGWFAMDDSLRHALSGHSAVPYLVHSLAHVESPYRSLEAVSFALYWLTFSDDEMTSENREVLSYDKLKASFLSYLPPSASPSASTTSPSPLKGQGVTLPNKPDPAKALPLWTRHFLFRVKALAPKSF